MASYLPLTGGTISGATTNLSSLYISGNTTLNNVTTCGSSLNVSGITTLNNNTSVVGTLNVSSNIIGNGSALTNLNYNAITNPPAVPNLNVASTFISSLNVSGVTTFQGASTCLSSLNVSGNTTFQGVSNLLSNVNITNNSSLIFDNQLNTNKLQLYTGYGFGIENSTLRYNTQAIHKFYAGTLNTFTIDNTGTATIANGAYIANGISITGATNAYQSLSFRSLNYNLGVAGGTGQYSTSAIQNDMILRTIPTTNLILQSGGGASAITINPSNNILLYNSTTVLSSLNVSGITNLSNATTCLSSLNVSGNTTFQGASTCLSTFNISGTTIINGNLTCNSTLTTNTSNSNVLVSYFLPTPYNNGSTSTNQAATSVINLCTSTTAGFAVTAPYLSVKCSDIVNAYGTIVTLSSQGGYWSGSNLYNSIILDSSYATNGAGDGATISFNSGSRTMCTINRNGFIVNNGGLGIGTTAPQAKFDIYGNTPSMVIRGSSEADSSILYLGTPFDSSSAFKCAFIAQGQSTYSRSKLHFCLDNTASNSTAYNASVSNARMTIDYTGNVGINTTTPSYPLVVTGTSNNYTIGSGSYTYNYAGQYGNPTNYTASILAYFNGNVLTPSSYISFSDARIKKNIEDLENEYALKTIMKLNPISYEYIDTVLNNDSTNYGFIAQEVEKVLPQAVISHTNFIPSIFKNVESVDNANKNIVIANSNLIINDIIKLIDHSNKEQIRKITNIDSNIITLDKEIDNYIDGDPLFLFGKQIEDLKCLNHNVIHNLNVKATQDLYQIILLQQEEIEQLKTRLEILENKNI